MRRGKKEWESIYKECAEIIASSITSKGKSVSTIKDVYKKYRKKHSDDKSDLPKESIFRKNLSKKIQRAENETYKDALYRFADFYNKLSFKSITQHLNISENSVDNEITWVFARIKQSDLSKVDSNKLLYNLSIKLKKKFPAEILFISFDTDTVVIMCNKDSCDKICDYFKNSHIPTFLK